MGRGERGGEGEMRGGGEGVEWKRVAEEGLGGGGLTIPLHSRTEYSHKQMNGDCFHLFFITAFPNTDSVTKTGRLNRNHSNFPQFDSYKTRIKRDLFNLAK